MPRRFFTPLFPRLSELAGDDTQREGGPTVRLSVVIPVLNEERHLGQLLSDIRWQSLRPGVIAVFFMAAVATGLIPGVEPLGHGYDQ